MLLPPPPLPLLLPLLSFATLLAWCQHYFAKVFNPTKNTIVDTIRIVMEDLKVTSMLGSS
jgi:hypothetical protein